MFWFYLPYYPMTSWTPWSPLGHAAARSIACPCSPRPPPPSPVEAGAVAFLWRRPAASPSRRRAPRPARPSRPSQAWPSPGLSGFHRSLVAPLVVAVHAVADELRTSIVGKTPLQAQDRLQSTVENEVKPHFGKLCFERTQQYCVSLPIMGRVLR